MRLNLKFYCNSPNEANNPSASFLLQLCDIKAADAPKILLKFQQWSRLTTTFRIKKFNEEICYEFATRSCIFVVDYTRSVVRHEIGGLRAPLRWPSSSARSQGLSVACKGQQLATTIHFSSLYYDNSTRLFVVVNKIFKRVYCSSFFFSFINVLMEKVIFLIIKNGHISILKIRYIK